MPPRLALLAAALFIVEFFSMRQQSPVCSHSSAYFCYVPVAALTFSLPLPAREGCRAMASDPRELKTGRQLQKNGQLP
jgi:hypothetical protein